MDTFHLPYIQFPDFFTMPQVTLHDLHFSQAREIVNLLAKMAPALVSDCFVLPEARPRRDSDQLQLVRPYRSAAREYLFILKIVLKYMGGARDAEILAPGSQGKTPAFRSNRLYFESLLFPVQKITFKDGALVDFESLQIKDAIFKVTESSQGKDIWSAVLFDEVDYSLINRRFSEMLAFDTQWKMPRLFWPFVIDYLSLCLNLVHPDRRLVDFIQPYFDRAFTALLPGTLPLELDGTDRRFWRGYYDAWTYEPVASRAGNPHWALRQIPDHTMLERNLFSE